MPAGKQQSGVNGQAATVSANGGTMFVDLDVEGVDEITVIGQLGPTAAAASDVSIAVQPYLADYQDGVWQSGSGTNEGYQNDPALADAGLDLVQTTIYPGIAAYLNATDYKARVMQRLDVKGFGKVRIILKNNNVTTALPGRIDYFFE